MRSFLLDGVALRRALFVLACGLVGMALAALYAAQKPATYEASATVLVASVTRDDGGSANPLTETNDAQQKVLTLAQLATSNLIIERVIAAIGLDQAPESLGARVSAEAVPQTVLVKISAQDPDRDQARVIANAVALELEIYVEELNEQASGSAAITTVELVDPALIPNSPISPRPAIMLALGLIGGLAGGLILTAAVARRDDLLRTESRVEQVTGLPSLGSVPRVVGRHLTPVDVATHQASVQHFKGIRNNLMERLPTTKSPVVAVVSAEGEEGRTSLTLGLARALANDGHAVLVVDGDLRQHVLTSVLELGDRPGWANSLDNGIPPSDLVVKDAWESVDVVGVGPQAPHYRANSEGTDGDATTVKSVADHELGALQSAADHESKKLRSAADVDSKTLQKVLYRLRRDYDVVLVDTANLNNCADSAIVSRHADGAVLVFPSGQVGPQEVTLATDSVVKAGGKVLGTVLNFAARSARG